MSAAVCPYCRTALPDGPDANKVFCNGCGTPHHQDCYNENGGCTVFGCRCAPADDPKLQVSYSELQTVPVVQPVQTVQPQPLAVSAVQPVQYPPSPYGGPLGLSQPAASPQAGTATSAAAASAPAAGYAVSPQVPYVYASAPKARVGFVLLGIFLGALGIHNFYAGYVGKGVGQLCLSVLTLGYGALFSWIWAIVEVCVIDKDSTGVPFS